ncbi:hemagglutinin/amebocyte aggregation factor [Elysia marginata]|uniref:Hemagglutinin/amebocyte aggregation factor n=1 Tax=Elysia marginata TaxID=1093978 RepID=A0AAV4HAN3_9GAST|nr:hemagglutinin/amebocyte aggregation factor [Elysia marginata]
MTLYTEERSRTPICNGFTTICNGFATTQNGFRRKTVMVSAAMSLKSAAMLALLVVAVVTANAVVDFNNDWDGNLQFECPEDQVIHSVYSIHDSTKEDRRWKFGCSPTPGDAKPKKCEWTENFVNHLDGPVMFLCPANYLIAGVASVHDNAAEDRRMKFKCCRRPGYKTKSCEMTDYLNNWDDPLNYTVPNGKVLAGWMSVHDNSKEDRRHRMVECKYGR